MKIGLIITYDGAGFCGWQIQPKKRSVEGVLTDAVSLILGERVVLYASGRTDAGVHALGQVAHFETTKTVNIKTFAASVNHFLPDDVKVISAFEASDDFDARFTAKQKTYIYKFYKSRFELPLKIGRELRVNDNINIDLIKLATGDLVGEFDFKSFVAKKSGKTNFVRKILDAKINQLSDFEFEFEITGTGFLYNMVRIIMGTLIDIGMGRKGVHAITQIIADQSRASAGKTMPPYALYLKEVKY